MGDFLLDEAAAAGEGVRQMGAWVLAQAGPLACDRLPKTEANKYPHTAQDIRDDKKSVNTS